MVTADTILIIGLASRATVRAASRPRSNQYPPLIVLLIQQLRLRLGGLLFEVLLLLLLQLRLYFVLFDILQVVLGLLLVDDARDLLEDESLVHHEPAEGNVILLVSLPAVEEGETRREHEEVVKYVEKVQNLMVLGKEGDNRDNVPDGTEEDHAGVHIERLGHQALGDDQEQVVEYDGHECVFKGKGILLLH